MRKNYVKPQVLVHNTRVQSYILKNSYGTNKDTDIQTLTEYMLTKDRDSGDEIWGNNEEENAW